MLDESDSKISRLKKTKTIRFRENELEDMKAWNYLNQINKEEYKSQNRFVIRAIIEFYERQKKNEEDPYFETREKEEAFINRIVSDVEKKAFEKLTELYDINLFQNISVKLKESKIKIAQIFEEPTRFTESDNITNTYVDIDAFG